MIRPLVRGVIVDEDRILLTVNRLGDDEIYLPPGGEPQTGEPILTALVRHVREQTGYEATADQLLWVREHLPSDQANRPGSHTVELLYRCTLQGAAAAVPHRATPQQVGVEWVSRDRLSTLALQPRSLAAPLDAYLTDRGVTAPVYAVEDS